MNTQIKVLTALGVSILILGLFMVKQDSGGSFGGAPDGLATTVATTSQFAITTSQQILFATSTCDSRIISTRAQPVMLSFSDVQGFVPTAVLGHQQAASTTVVYDASVYGCNAVRVISATPSGDTVTASETR